MVDLGPRPWEVSSSPEVMLEPGRSSKKPGRRQLEQLHAHPWTRAGFSVAQPLSSLQREEFSCQGGRFSWVESGSKSSDGSGRMRGNSFSIRKCGTGSLVMKIQTSLPWRGWSVPWGSGRVTAQSQGAGTGWNHLRSEVSISDLALTANGDTAAGLGAAGFAAAGLGFTGEGNLDVIKLASFLIEKPGAGCS